MPRLGTAKPRLGSAPTRLQSAPSTEADRSRLRDQTKSWRAWYKTARWQRLRRKVLKRDGLRCQATGALLLGKHPEPNSPVVDHRIPHRGDPVLFWDEGNLQVVSKAYHDKIKQRLEHQGRI